MKTFLFAVWLLISSFSLFLINSIIFSVDVSTELQLTASSPVCQSWALTLVTALLSSHVKTLPMKLHAVIEEQTNLLKE